MLKRNHREPDSDQYGGGSDGDMDNLGGMRRPPMAPVRQRAAAEALARVEGKTSKKPMLRLKRAAKQ